MPRDLLATNPSDVTTEQQSSVQGGRDLLAGREDVPTSQPPPPPKPPLERLLEAYRKGEEMSDRHKELIEEISRRKGLGLVYGMDSDKDEFGPLDYLMSFLEPALTVGSGIVAEPVAGLAGIAGSVIPGEEGQGARAVESTREALTYMPRTRGGMTGLEKVGGVMAPVGRFVEKAERAVGDPAYAVGGPVAGAAAVTALNAIPELLGLKGTRAAKKAMLGKVLRNVDPSEIYDELGNLLPEIQRAVENSGLSVKEIEEMIQAVSADDAIRQSAERVGDAAKARVRKGPAYERIAEDVRPSQEILDAAAELGLEDQLLPSHYSQNPVYVSLEQGLKSIPASQLSVREKALIDNLGQRANSLIEEFGGTLDKAGLSDEFSTRARQLVEDLSKKADDVYGQVREAIPKDTPVEANNLINVIMDHAEELGGIEYLKPVEKRLLKQLDPETNPTYARLDEVRRDLGMSYKNRGPFKDSADATVDRLYGALAKDQRAAAKAHDVGDLYEIGTDLVITRKGIEKQMVKGLGKDLMGSISVKAGKAVRDLSKGDTKAFDQLMEIIPEQMGKETKRQIVLSALNDAFTQGSRKEQYLSIPGMDDFMNGLNKNKAAKDRLTDVLGEDVMERLETFHKVVSGVRKAQSESITTGRILAVPGILDEQTGLARRLFGTAAKAAAAEGVTSSMGAPGVGTTGVIVNALASGRTKRSVAADRLLSSPKFQKILREHAKKGEATQDAIERATRALERLKEYQRWKDTLPERDLTDLAAVGAIGYLTGKPVTENEEGNSP